jgi:hypothetical protein
MSPPDYGDNISAAVTVPGGRKQTSILSLTACLLIVTLTLAG